MVKLNIQMPDHCRDCPCANEETYCQAVNRPLNSETYDKRRPPWCPLISDKIDPYTTIGEVTIELLKDV